MARRAPTWITATVGVSWLAGLLAFAFLLYGHLTMVKLIPWSGVIVLANWLPPGAAFLAGIVARQQAIPLWRRRYLAMLILATAWYTVAYDLIGPSPRAGDPDYLKGVSIQTTPASCSPCSAVTLLTEHGIPATEAEMMRLCLTRSRGTSELGLYRALLVKTKGTPWTVKVLRGDVETLRRQLTRPAILLFDVYAADVSRSRTSWLPKASHTVVAYRFNQRGELVVADPSAGPRVWSTDVLERGWYGEAIQLVPRQTTTASTH